MPRHPAIELDDTDRSIINRIQSDFPAVARPYAVVADELSLDEATVIARVARLKEAGIIRRIGGNFAPDRLGFVSTLCAARVPGEKVDDFAQEVNRYPGVTHNYLREHAYNVWFTFIAETREEIVQNLADIRAATGITDILDLPATSVYKIRAEFKVGREE
ncbi:MAG: AsnC family transcriptional regulator [Proteobacteria bacterium]|nr:AsnC family transcriptional regulator [Pseudomonadota bacterium]